jgi:hypothetical protein
MAIKKIAILPPLAFARFGSHPEPVDSYTLEAPSPDEPLGYRKIKPEPTLVVSDDGEIVVKKTVLDIRFKQDGKVRPVAPFFELWAELDNGDFVPVTKDLLGDAQLQWSLEVANRKVFRRTQMDSDIVSAKVEFSDHKVHQLRGECANFVEGGAIAFGSVRYIKPNEEFPHIRLRFTPGAGLIYGTENKIDGVEEPFLETRRIYKSTSDQGDSKSTDDESDDENKSWWMWKHPPEPEKQLDLAKDGDIETIPPSLFAIFPPAPPWLNQNKAISRGYLDDACDGFVRAKLVVNGNTLEAKARIGVAPPHYAPNSLFVRNLIDDLEQARDGTMVEGNSRERALDIVRRAFETVRFMNVAVMNGNPFKGRDALELDTMPAEEAFGTERPLRPVFAPGGADTRAVAALHQRAYAALSSGSAGWFTKLLRQPEDVGDLTDEGRRRMPALMCGAESLYLALTRRQISAIQNLDFLPKEPQQKSAIDNPDSRPKHAKPWPLYPIDAAELQKIRPCNRTAELMYKPVGNPISSHPIVAIANCCPGLEFDFRAVWRRLLEGITLVEWDNLVVEAKGQKLAGLKGRRLLKVDGRLVITDVQGPRPSDPTEPLPLISDQYPDGVVTMEWSNNFAHILSKAGQEVVCVFGGEPWGPREAWPETAEEIKQANLVEHKLRVRNFFEDDSLVVSEELAKPGELTQGLCSPWQNDFRECSCYYWASARPDYVNVEPGPDGNSFGQNWMQKGRMDPKRPKSDYIADDYRDSRLILYDDLFKHWEELLEFQVDGKDPEP